MIRVSPGQPGSARVSPRYRSSRPAFGGEESGIHFQRRDDNTKLVKYRKNTAADTWNTK